jgi:glycosyltransferase involved in cell wall biosynthesis
MQMTEAVKLVAHFCASPIALDQHYGGVSNVATALARCTAQSGLETLVVCGDSLHGRPIATTGDYQVSNHLRIVTVALNTSNATLVGTLSRLISALPAGTIAHVHAGFSPFSDQAMRLLKKHGIPYIYSPHGQLSPGRLKKRWLIKMIYLHLIGLRLINAAGAIGIFARGECKLFSKLGIRAGVVEIPNGYEYPGNRSDWMKPKDLDYVLYLGRLDARKQPELLIRAFACPSSDNLRHMAV